MSVWSGTGDTLTYAGAEAPEPLGVRPWLRMAFPVYLPLRRRDLEEAGAIEGFSPSNINDGMNALRLQGVIERIDTGVWRRVHGLKLRDY